MEFGKAIPYDIKISSSSNKGFIVKVGCSESVFTDVDSLLTALELYLENPEKMEKEYNDSNQGPEVTQDIPEGDSNHRALRGLEHGPQTARG